MKNAGGRRRFRRSGAEFYDSRGSGLVVVLVTILVLSAMSLALVLLSITETTATDNSRRAASALYAAQAGIERALPDLAREPHWDRVLDGSTSSGFVDGAPGGARSVPGGRTISLQEVVNLANCGLAAPCTVSEMDAVTAERPWGRNNPRWRLFAYGPIRALAADGDGPAPDEYVVVLAGDDPAEHDDDPARDGRAGSAGEGVLLLRAEAFGPRASHRVVEATVARGVPAAGASGYVGQRGEGATAGSGARAGIATPGGPVSRMEVGPDGGMTRQ